MLETNLSCCVKLTRDFVKFMLEAPSSELDHVGPIGDVAPFVFVQCLVKISGLLQIEILLPICVAKNNQRCLTISQIVSVQFPSFVGDFVLHQHFACGSSFISVCCDRNTFFLSDLVFRIPMLLLRVLLLKLSFGCFPNLCWDKLLYWLQWLASI